MPRVGAWHADFVVDTLDPSNVLGKATVKIDDGALTLVGTCYPNRSGVKYDTGFVRVVGGAGGLGTPTLMKYYSSTTLRLPLYDLLNHAGETLSPTCDPGLLAQPLNSWTTISQTTGNAIAALLQAVPLSTWRVLPDGTVWAGFDSWPPATLDYQMLTANPDTAEYEIGLDSPLLLPGYNLDGLNVSYVQHTLSFDRVRTRIWAQT